MNTQSAPVFYLYSLFQSVGTSLPDFRTIAMSSEVVTLEKEHCYAMHRKTSSDKLPLLVSGRRKELYLLLAQHHYISSLFLVLFGSDIDIYIGKRYHYDIWLPNFLQMSSPEMSKSSQTEHFQNSDDIVINDIKVSSFIIIKDSLHHSPKETAKYSKLSSLIFL
ncbi:hypothetical protein FD755_020066 [Muntiacus reevesi]|uniref:Uncharacterized protein n=1 Tax=Muntiacus reevesi TaxID=9886 RepID=A0A5N3X2G5_MUNRE|nr:hypothetical protein FD755_020066 [Muntiacus reevesi]